MFVSVGEGAMCCRIIKRDVGTSKIHGKRTWKHLTLVQKNFELHSEKGLQKFVEIHIIKI